MKEKFRMGAEKLSAPFRKIGSFIKKPFVKFYEKHHKGILKTVEILNKYSLLFHALWSMTLEFAIESFSRHSLAEGVAFMTGSPVVFLYNALLIFMTFTVVYLVRRRTVLRLGLSAIWLYGGYMNGTVLSNRVTPFMEKGTKIPRENALCEKYFRIFTGGWNLCRKYFSCTGKPCDFILFWKYCICISGLRVSVLF